MPNRTYVIGVGMTPFSKPGTKDGDYPDWPAQKALRWMPPDLIEKFGRVEESTFNGQFLHIRKENEDNVYEVWVKNQSIPLPAGFYQDGDKLIKAVSARTKLAWENVKTPAAR